MNKCEFIDKCPFFNKLEENAMYQLVEKMKSNYCLTDNSLCARLKLRNILGPQSVPVLMMPHQTDWANQIMLDHQTFSSSHQQ